MDISKLFSRALAQSWSLVLSGGIALLISVIVPQCIARARLWHIPHVGMESGNIEKRRQIYFANARGLYSEGYQKVKSSKA
jgi:hypothetical protein